MLKLVNILILKFIFIKAVVSKTYGCDDLNISLATDELTFFHTPDYPKMWSKNSISYCQPKFYLNEAYDTVDNIKLMVYYTLLSVDNLASHGIYSSKKSEMLDVKYYDPYSPDELHNNYNAIATHFFFTNLKEECPMESISRIDPFEFTDEKQILYLRSVYEDYGNRTTSCKWQFSAPNGYGFKIVMEEFKVSETTELTIQNSTRIILTECCVRLYLAYYNSDSYIQISLSKGDPSFHTQVEFQAYVSIVKKNGIQSDGGCKIINNEAITIWTNINNREPVWIYEGYQNNVQCTFDLSVLPGTEVLVNVSPNLMEKGVDHLQYFDNTEIVTTENEMNFMLDSNKNGSNKIYPWKFTSDGSFQSLGFQVTFEEIICQCGPSLIIISEQEFQGSIMNRQDGLLCGNLKCNFTLQPKSVGNTIYAKFVTNVDRYANNKFRVYSNGVLVLKIPDNNQNTTEIYLNSSNQNVFEAKTFSSAEAQSLKFTFQIINYTALTTTTENSLSTTEASLSSFTLSDITCSTTSISSLSKKNSAKLNYLYFLILFYCYFF